MPTAIRRTSWAKRIGVSRACNCGAVLVDVERRVRPGEVEVDDALLVGPRAAICSAIARLRLLPGSSSAYGADGRDQVGRPVVEDVVGDATGRPSTAPSAGRAARTRGSGGGSAPRASARGRARRPAAVRSGSARCARGSRRARRSAAVRSGAFGIGGEVGRPRRRHRQARPRAPGPRPAGRTSGTGRCGRGRRAPGSAAGWPAPAGPAVRAPASRGRRPAPARRASGCRIAVTSATSGADRCWARKMRNTASSSSGRALQIGDAVVREHALAAWCGTARAARRARGRGSAGRCGSTRAGCAPAARCALPRRRAGCGSARRSRRRCSSSSISPLRTSTPRSAAASRCSR